MCTRWGLTSAVGVPSDRKEDETVTFVTNLVVSDGTLEDRRRTRRVMRRYARRWGIENSYKSINDFLVWTTSRNTAVRVFYFGFAVILYNMWLLVDLLVQISLDIDQRLKPRVPARTFTEHRSQGGTRDVGVPRSRNADSSEISPPNYDIFCHRV